MKTVKNNLFFGDFIKTVVLEKYMPVSCFWTNIVVYFVDKKVEIISNARIEQFFRLIKHNVLQSQMHQRATIFLRKLQEHIESLLELVGLKIDDMYATNKGLKNALLRKEERLNNIEDATDDWQSRKVPKGKIIYIQT